MPTPLGFHERLQAVLSVVGGIKSEEDKRATTNVQDGLAFCDLFSFVPLCLFELKR